MKAGYAALVGQPNSGKSSLLNKLVEEKISIVTNKPQTTRRRVIGVVQKNDNQIVFVDSPGLVQGAKGLNKFLEKEANEVISEADIIVAVLAIDEEEKTGVERVLEIVASSTKPKIFVINKIDLQKFHHRIRLTEEMITSRFSDAKIFKISAAEFSRDGENEKALVEHILTLLPDSPGPIFDSEIFTPHSLRDLACEIVREKCFEVLHMEVPYQLAVKIEKFVEEPDITRIWADIWVGKESHKGIVIGKQGSVLKEIGILARKDIEKLLGQKVFLALNVVYKDNWFLKEERMKEIGYAHPNS